MASHGPPSSGSPRRVIGHLHGGPLDGATVPIADAANPPEHWRFQGPHDNRLVVYVIRQPRTDPLTYDYSHTSVVAEE